jgi:hypothetical protein
MERRDSLLFIAPHIRFDLGDGIAKKIRSQARALEERFIVTRAAPAWKGNLLARHAELVLFQRRVISAAPAHRAIYYRYAPYLPLLNVYLAKCRPELLVLEMNGFVKELDLTGRTRQRLLAMMFGRKVIKAAHTVLTFTEELRDEISTLVPGAAPVIMPNGYDLEPDPRPPSDDLEGILGWMRERKRTGAVAIVASSFAPYHGIDKILDLLAQCDALAVVLAGQGAGFESAERRIAELGLGSRALLAGWRELNDLSLLYAEADFAFGSMAPERVGLSQLSSLKVREYLFHGLPAVLGNHDAAVADFPWVTEYSGRENLLEFIARARSFDRAEIRREAEKRLSWRHVLLPLIPPLAAKEKNAECGAVLTS